MEVVRLEGKLRAALGEEPAPGPQAGEDFAKYTGADMLRECFEVLEAAGARSATSSEPPQHAIERLAEERDALRAELHAAREACREALELADCGWHECSDFCSGDDASGKLFRQKRDAIEAKLRAVLGEEKGNA